MPNALSSALTLRFILASFVHCIANVPRNCKLQLCKKSCWRYTADVRTRQFTASHFDEPSCAQIKPCQDLEELCSTWCIWCTDHIWLLQWRHSSFSFQSDVTQKSLPHRQPAHCTNGVRFEYFRSLGRTTQGVVLSAAETRSEISTIPTRSWYREKCTCIVDPPTRDVDLGSFIYDRK